KRFLEDQLNERRRAQAEQARAEAETAKREAVGKHALVEELAQNNATLTEELTELAVALDRIDDEQAEVEAQSKRIAEEFLSARQRLEISGLTQVLGQVLLDRRQQLPDQRIHRKAAKKRERIIADASLHQIRFNEERRRLRDIDAYLDELTADLAPEEQAGVRDELRELAEQRKALLDQALTTENAYVRALGELDYVSDQLLETVDRYDDFLAERLLWVRNAPPIGSEVAAALPGAIAWLIWPSNWLDVAQVLLHEALASPLIWLATLIALALLWKSRAIHAAVLETATPLRRVGTDRISYTLQGLGLTVLLAAPWPLLTAILGWHLSSSLEATAFTKAVGQGALSAAFGFFSLLAFRLLCMKGGVADRHFRWSERLLQTINSNFDWALWILLPAGLLAGMVYNFPDPRYSGSLGRITLLVLMLGLAVFTARLIHPKSGVLQSYLLERPDGWVNRLRHVWFPLLVAVPLFLAVLTLVGYVYTAGTLLKSLVSELWLVLGLVVTHQVIVRWLILMHRRLALQAAIERRTEKAEEEGIGSILHVEEPEVDLASLDEQTRKLINTLLFFGALVGLWVIWSDVLPAFGIFEGVALWHHIGIVDGQERSIPVTLADVGLVLFIAAIATVAVKNLPALLEILLLQRISLSSGSRYTVKTLTGYVIVAAAALIVFSTLGLSWSQVQWLVAALGVGIGFGLQEIVANFISGLIILFERPVRVGDIVTIGDTTGVVSRIQIRATTIRNWDKQELLVPNKEFITGRLLNWSLSDTMNRIVINIGVGYGSNVPLALKLLTESAEENERVLDDPGPLVTFEGFGDNALTLVLRCYLESLDYRLAVTTELHQAINDKFQAAGISIAFPQRDVHLSTSEPLDVRVRQPSPATREASPPTTDIPPDTPAPGRSEK
ncbi:MAG: mechanosensitive ion channel, partial [Pseudomonadota bacterium]|nr:mechanosensitive ion channel [Pseudomonadota bacterium]